MKKLLLIVGAFCLACFGGYGVWHARTFNQAVRNDTPIANLSVTVTAKIQGSFGAVIRFYGRDTSWHKFCRQFGGGDGICRVTFESKEMFHFGDELEVEVEREDCWWDCMITNPVFVVIPQANPEPVHTPNGDADITITVL